MTDTDRPTSDETHGPTLDVDQGLEKLQTAELVEQIEQQDAADAAADAFEVLDDASALASSAGELEAELEAALGETGDLEASDEERSNWQAEVIEAAQRAESYSDEGRFFARIANQLVEIRQATRIAQAINQHYPTFLQDRRASGEAEHDIEALFDRARAGTNAVFSLLAATIRTLEQCDPPGLRGPVSTASVPSHAAAAPPAAVVQRRGPQPPANRPAAVQQTAPLRGVPPHLAGDAPDDTIPEARVDPVRARVVAVQRQLEERRQQQQQVSTRGGVAPHVGRVAPRPQVQQRKRSGPIAGRVVQGERDPATALILASRQLLEDLRRRARNVERERITRYCKSVERLAQSGRISERLGTFAVQVQNHQNAKNVAKLASFFLAEMKGKLPT